MVPFLKTESNELPDSGGVSTRGLWVERTGTQQGKGVFCWLQFELLQRFHTCCNKQIVLQVWYYFGFVIDAFGGALFGGSNNLLHCRHLWEVENYSRSLMKPDAGFSPLEKEKSTLNPILKQFI